MSRRLFSLFITAAMFMVTTTPSWAKNNSPGSISVTITLNEKASLNNTTLDPGD